jgi:hypothetical protein
MLKLMGDLDDWVHRRVETHSFSPEDPKVIVRKTSIDFTLPCTAAVQVQGHPSGANAVPITFAHKWRLLRFDIRDESGRALPLLAREEHCPLATGMLMALAYEICGAGVPPENREAIPLEIEEDLRAIVYEEADAAVCVCNRLGAAAMGADTPPEDIERVMRWRRRLVTSEAFMELAYELAKYFLVIALCPPPLNVRRILKVSYEEPTDHPPNKRIAKKLSRWYVWVKRRLGDDDWRSTDGEPATACGRLVLSSICERLTIGSQDADDIVMPCVMVTIKTPHRRKTSLLLNSQDIREIPNLPVGEYELNVEALSGFQLMGASIVKVKIAQEEPARYEIACRQLIVAVKRRWTTSIPVPPRGWGRRLSQAMAWRSKPILIKLRLGDGGSYHFEFEAPPGLQVTRAKIADDRRGVLDIELRSTQRTHLYVPAPMCEPATAYALLNLRPRAETVVRGATLTSLITSLMVLAVIVRWQITGNAGPDGIALLVALPAMFAAYFAYTGPSNVTNAMLPWLRIMALVPGAMAFGAAAIVLDGDTQHWALALLDVLFITLIAVTSALGLALRWSTRPREQRSTSGHQSPAFDERYLSEGGLAIETTPTV